MAKPGLINLAVTVSFLVAGALCVFPVLFMLGGAFWHNGHPSFFHFAAAFSDTKRIVLLLSNSLVLAAGTVCISLFIGVPAGFLCFRTNLPFRRIIIAGSLLAACIPLYVTATCWMALFGMHFWLYNTLGASWISGIAYAPLATLISGACFAAGDRELEDAASLDTGLAGVFRHAVLPAGSWGIAAAAMVVTILSLWDITVTDILMIRTFGEEVSTQFQLTGDSWSAAAISVPAAGVQLLLLILAWRLLRAHGEASLWGMAGPPRAVDLGRMRWFFALAALLVITALFLIPLGALLKTVGSPAKLATAWRTAHEELVATFRVTSIAATVCMIIAAPAAWTLLRAGKCRLPVATGLLLLVSVPAPVAGIGLVKLLNREGVPGMVYDSEAVLMFAYVIRTLPFGVLALLPAWKRIPREITEASTLDGASWTRRLFSIVVPCSWPAVLAAWLLVFVLALSEIGASFLVTPPGRATLSIRFFTLIHYGVYPDAAGICLILLAIAGTAAAGIAAILWRAMKRDMGAR